MKRRTQKEIIQARNELSCLIKKMETVENIMEWKNHPYSSDNKRFTVEAYNKDTIKQLEWDRADVLYSFLGIYVIGLIAYYPHEYSRDGILIKNSQNKEIYRLDIINSIVKDKQKLYEEKKLKKDDILDFNPQLIEFIKKYFSIGNVIPTWPGANVDRGRAFIYDIPELYFSKYEIWARILNEMYRNAFLDDLLNPNLVFKDNNEINYSPAFWNFSSIEEFLDNMVADQYKKEQRIALYSKWLERIVGIIKKREQLIKDFLLTHNI